eukprot:218411_1
MSAGYLEDIPKEKLRLFLNSYKKTIKKEYETVQIIPEIMQLIFLYLYVNWGNLCCYHPLLLKKTQNIDKYELKGSLNHKIDGIRIYSGWLIDSIQLRINGIWGSKYGGDGGGKNEIILKDNEYINYILCNNSYQALSSILIKTNQNRMWFLGGNHGRKCKEQPQIKNEILINIKVYYNNFMQGLQFQWSETPMKKIKTKAITGLVWEDVIGSTKGNLFDYKNEIGNKIEGIRIRCGGWIDAIQICVNEKWLQQYGGTGGGMHQLILKDNEYICDIVAVGDANHVNGIAVNTNKNRQLYCGSANKDWWSIPNNSNRELVNIKGKCDQYLNQIQFLWNYK